DRHDVRRRAAQLAMSIGYFSGARANLEYLDKAVKDDPEVIPMLARCHDGLSDFKNARKEYERAIKVAPRELDAYARLAALLRHRTADVLYEKETANAAEKLAKEKIEAMVTANKDSYRAYLLHAQYFGTLPKQTGPDAEEIAEKISADFARAETLAPDAAHVLLANAHIP